MLPEDSDSCRALVDEAPVMLWRAGPAARCEHVNAAWLAFTGRRLEQETGEGWLDDFHAEDRAAFRAACVDHAAAALPFESEYRLRRHDGVHRRVLMRGAPARGGLSGTCVELDEQDAFARLSEFFDMSLDNLCVTGFDGYFKRVNASWSRTLGWSPEELMSKPVLEFVHPDDRQGVLDARRGLVAGAPLVGLVNRYRCKDGTYRWFEWRSVAQADRELVYAAARDVSVEREAQQQLLELTESLTTILDSIEDGVIATNADAAITRMNPVAERLTGSAFDEQREKPLHDAFHVVDTTAGGTAASLVERVIRDGKATARPVEARLVARDGTTVPIALSCAPMRHPDGSVRGAVIVFRDMTAEKDAKQAQERLQRQLIFADRMASVGTLAAGVAHEINNPLAYVAANLDMLTEEMQPDVTPDATELADWLELAREAREGTERIRKIVRGLKTFSRSEEERIGTTELRPVLEVSIDMAFIEIRHRARLVKDYGAVPPVDADDARLSQVFINLLVNAAQAIPEGAAEHNEIRISTSTDAAGRAVVEVSDTGPGIPPDVMDRIFDPFFTTKPIGVGTGLGLWICHHIVTSLGGEITAHNRPTGGASFRVALPASLGTHAPRGARRRSAPVPRSRASVLVVDDDRAVGVALARVLRDHEVTVVSSGREALDLLLSEARFDVVLSDLMMPEMTGMELYERVAEARPGLALRIVFLSGGAFTPAARAFLDQVPNERLEKPFDANLVRELVQRFAR